MFLLRSHRTACVGVSLIEEAGGLACCLGYAKLYQMPKPQPQPHELVKKQNEVGNVMNAGQSTDGMGHCLFPAVKTYHQMCSGILMLIYSSQAFVS
jgi:hypothetical protein